MGCCFGKTDKDDGEQEGYHQLEESKQKDGGSNQSGIKHQGSTASDVENEDENGNEIDVVYQNDVPSPVGSGAGAGASPNIKKQLTIKDFQIIKVLGRGSFGQVMLVQQVDDKQLYAMKTLKQDIVNKKNQRLHTKAERQILQGVKHPFIVKLHYAFQTKEKLYLAMDFMIGGELFFHLRQSYKFNQERSKLYTAELILAIEHLHQNGIVYRDLKPENILLGSDGHLKITDFGLSKTGLKDDEQTYTFCGTPEYLAPEILLNKGHDKTVDWWSLGALLYEMLTGAPPFYSKDQTKMFKLRLEKPIEMKPWFSPNASSIIQGLLNNNPDIRLGQNGAEEIQKHAFFSDIDWDKVYRKEYEPPFKPKVANANDLKHFDKMFTDEPVRDTPAVNIGSRFNDNQDAWDNFTYVKDEQHSMRLKNGEAIPQAQDYQEDNQYISVNPNFKLK